MFQFQNGSINSTTPKTDNIYIMPFQFQNGSINSWNTLLGATSGTLVSIPKWFD